MVVDQLKMSYLSTSEQMRTSYYLLKSPDNPGLNLFWVHYD